MEENIYNYGALVDRWYCAIWTETKLEVAVQEDSDDKDLMVDEEELLLKIKNSDDEVKHESLY